MLSKELDRKANEKAGYAQQNQRPNVNVKYEDAWLCKELDTLVVERDVSHRQRGKAPNIAA